MMDLVAAPWYPTKARFDLYKKRERRMCLDWLVSYFGARLFRPSPASRDELRAALSGSLFRAADHLARYESTGRVRYVVFCMIRGEPLPYYEAKGVLSLIDRLRTSTERRILFADAFGIHPKVMDPSEAHRFVSNVLFPQIRE